MKVNFKSMMVAATLLAGFASCSNDDVPSAEGADNGKPASFTISITQPKTYAVDVNATEEESKLTSVDVFIFTQGNMFLKHEHLEGADFNLSTDNEYTSITKIATTVGPKKVYVGVNLPLEVAQKVSTSGIDAIHKVANAAELKPNGFVMFTKEAIVTDFVIDTDPNASTKNKVKATVTRLLAKVSVSEDNNLSKETVGGKVSDLSFSLGQVAQSYYMLPKDNSPAGTEFYTANAATDYQQVNSGTPAVKDLKVAYAVENKQATPVQNNSTYAAIRAKFIPYKVHKMNAVGDGLEEDTAPNSPKTFYTVINGALRFFFLDKQDAEAYANLVGSNVAPDTYKDGYCYYLIYLNPNDDFSIVRNNFYKVNLKKINGLGRSTDEPGKLIPDPGNPGSPISKPTNITVDVTVENWSVIAQDAEI